MRDATPSTAEDTADSPRPKLTVIGGNPSRQRPDAGRIPPPVDPLEAEAAALPDEFYREELDAVIALFRLIRSNRHREAPHREAPHRELADLCD